MDAASINHEFDVTIEDGETRGAIARADFFLAKVDDGGFDCAGTAGTWGSLGGCIGTVGTFGCCC